MLTSPSHPENASATGPGPSPPGRWLLPTEAPGPPEGDHLAAELFSCSQLCIKETKQNKNDQNRLGSWRSRAGLHSNYPTQLGGSISPQRSLLSRPLQKDSVALGAPRRGAQGALARVALRPAAPHGPSGCGHPAKGRSTPVRTSGQGMQCRPPCPPLVLPGYMTRPGAGVLTAESRPAQGRHSPCSASCPGRTGAG